MSKDLQKEIVIQDVVISKNNFISSNKNLEVLICKAFKVFLNSEEGKKLIEATNELKKLSK